MSIEDFEEWNRKRRGQLHRIDISLEELNWAAEKYPDMKMSEYKRLRAEGKIKFEKTSPLDISKV
jgi:hypothetical protein